MTFQLLIERGGFYDRAKELNWKNLRDVQYVAAMAPPGGWDCYDRAFITPLTGQAEDGTL